jgi:hypothetical protein
VICFATRAEAAAEAVRLTQEADNNPRVVEIDFTAVQILESGDGRPRPTKTELREQAVEAVASYEGPITRCPPKRRRAP